MGKAVCSSGETEKEEQGLVTSRNIGIRSGKCIVKGDPMVGVDTRGSRAPIIVWGH